MRSGDNCLTVREELGIPKPTKREEARRHRRAMVEGTRLGRNLIGAMAEYVRFKKNACCNGLEGDFKIDERRTKTRTKTWRIGANVI